MRGGVVPGSGGGGCYNQHCSGGGLEDAGEDGSTHLNLLDATDAGGSDGGVLASRLGMGDGSDTGPSRRGEGDAGEVTDDLEGGVVSLNRPVIMDGGEAPSELDLATGWNDDSNANSQGENLEIVDDDNNEALVHPTDLAAGIQEEILSENKKWSGKKLEVAEDNIEVPMHPTQIAADLGDELISEVVKKKDQMIQCIDSLPSEEDGAGAVQDTVSSPADDPDASHNEEGGTNLPTVQARGGDPGEDLEGGIEPHSLHPQAPSTVMMPIIIPPPTMPPSAFSESSIGGGSVPVAQIVERELERPVYDAVHFEEEHWTKTHRKPIIVITGLASTIVIMAVALGLGSVNNDDTEAANISVKIPPQPTTFTSPLMTFPPTMTSLAHPSSPSSISVSPSMNLSPTSLTFPPFPPTIPQSTTPSFQPNEQPSLGPSEGPSSYSHRCFVDRTELKAAVDAYIAGGLDCSEENNCQVTQEYGWPIGTWCVSNITDMHALFERKYFFNEDISLWNTSAVVDMSSMFHRATAFNGDLSSWDTSEVANMRKMFNRADVFNGDVSNWDTSSVEDMTLMFRHATLFNQNLCAWGDSYQYNCDSGIFSFSGCTFQDTPQSTQKGPFCASSCDTFA
eukprot:CAMPEP_0172528674 /NCGR_PEP_ID=MMETSP1067-20121228/2990_1 /TAXON_ID=265564 ORGANISM="Thalassiosira punctigera, Strain Tpunct2005C2" /NCGR_SAMPLE_ID=MMETSP1067 /ASSEMBLY_ACC=CAM_ASM_000444 /LENGTH=621 /DNA_ID=CAMNT_0013312631 /DNA_START=166 /DNA_END=2031 /DNA_ORIENTATION=+